MQSLEEHVNLYHLLLGRAAPEPSLNELTCRFRVASPQGMRASPPRLPSESPTTIRTLEPLILPF